MSQQWSFADFNPRPDLQVRVFKLKDVFGTDVILHVVIQSCLKSLYFP